MGRVLVDDHQHSVVLHQPVGVEQLPDQFVPQPGLGVQKFGVEQVQLFRGGVCGAGGFLTLGSCPGGAFRLRSGASGGGRMILSFGLMTVCGDAAGRGRKTGAGLVCEIGAGPGRDKEMLTADFKDKRNCFNTSEGSIIPLPPVLLQSEVLC